MIRDVVQLDILPDNVLICIFQHLDSSSIFALRQASKRLKQIGDEEDCWKKMCIEDIPHMISKCNIPQKAFISLQKLKEIDSMNDLLLRTFGISNKGWKYTYLCYSRILTEQQKITLGNKQKKTIYCYKVFRILEMFLLVMSIIFMLFTLFCFPSAFDKRFELRTLQERKFPSFSFCGFGLVPVGFVAMLFFFIDQKKWIYRLLATAGFIACVAIWILPFVWLDGIIKSKLIWLIIPYLLGIACILGFIPKFFKWASDRKSKLDKIVTFISVPLLYLGCVATIILVILRCDFSLSFRWLHCLIFLVAGASLGDLALLILNPLGLHYALNICIFILFILVDVVEPLLFALRLDRAIDSSFGLISIPFYILCTVLVGLCAIVCFFVGAAIRNNQKMLIENELSKAQNDASVVNLNKLRSYLFEGKLQQFKRLNGIQCTSLYSPALI